MEEATYRGTVYPWQCDHVGHMNIMWYVGKFDEANWNFFARLGLTPSYLRESGRGMAAVQQNIAYKRNPNYWQKGLPYLDTVNYPAFLDNDPANAFLAAGQAQWGIRRADLLRFGAVGLCGYTFYQLGFVLGLERTSPFSSALLIGTVPVFTTSVVL